MKSHKNHFLLFILLSTSFAFSSQAQVTLNAVWDTAGKDLGQKTTIVIGDQLNIVLSVPKTGLQSINFPKLDDFSQNGIVPVSQHYDTIKTNDGSLLQRQITTVTCFDQGLHAIGGLQVQWMDGNHNMESILMTDSLSLIVKDYPNVDTTKAEIKDISGTISEPYTFWEIFRWILLVAVTGGLVWLIRHIIKNKKEQKPIITLKPKTPPIPPKQQALQDLETLRRSEMWQQGRIKEYYTQLTDIVRNYLKRRYRVDSTEMTSDQTMDAFASCSGFTSDRAILLQQMLRTADMVKFAKAEPQSYEHDKSLNDAVAFVSLEPDSQKVDDNDNNSNHQPDDSSFNQSSGNTYNPSQKTVSTNQPTKDKE
jgi:hypothetical protein